MINFVRSKSTSLALLCYFPAEGGSSQEAMYLHQIAIGQELVVRYKLVTDKKERISSRTERM